MNNDIVLIYMNWMRRDNLNTIISKTKKQTVLPKIVVIDNASKNPSFSFNSTDTYLTIINSDNSLKCWARWVEALNHNSKYICVMDDDLIFKNDFVLNRCVNYMEKETHIDSIGYEGVVLMKNGGYFDSKHYQCSPDKDIGVSIIKGRFMFLRTDSLDGLNLKPDLTCDDIKVSSHLKTKVLPSVLFDCFEDLPQGNESLSLKQYQRNAREFAKQKYFK
jgi:hypothetical protein